jgi:hypothetical protein
MMSRQLICVAAAVVLSLACAGYADVLLGDFEEGSLDDWAPVGDGSEVSLATSDFGATLGSSSLAATVASGGYWRVHKIVELDMTNKTTVRADVTFKPDEWVADAGAWAQLDAIAIQPNWFQVAPSSIINRDTGEEVGKAWGGAEEDSRRTYTWDITGKDWSGVTAVEIFLSLQWANYSQGGTFYIDNIQLIGPEAGPPLGNAILVTEQIDLDGDGVRDDQGLEDFLKFEGYTVDVQPGYWAELDPNKIAALEATDLIVISRTANSGNYDDGDEPTQWNSISTPLVQMSAYLVRNSRWKWVDSATATNNSDSPLMEVLVPEHPVFADVALDPNNQVKVIDETVGSGQTSFIGSLDMGNGILLAKAVAEEDLGWIAEWPAGVEFYDEAGQVASGPRMRFMACTQEVGATPQGAFNLTAEGQLMLSNALKYMLSLKEIEVENTDF